VTTGSWLDGVGQGVVVELEALGSFSNLMELGFFQGLADERVLEDEVSGNCA